MSFSERQFDAHAGHLRLDLRADFFHHRFDRLAIARLEADEEVAPVRFVQVAAEAQARF